MLITLMLADVARKSSTFSSFSHSADDQVCGSWEGARPDRQPGCPAEIFHTVDVMLGLGMAGWGAGIFVFLSLFLEFESSLVCEFELFHAFVLFRESCKIGETCDFWVPRLPLGD